MFDESEFEKTIYDAVKNVIPLCSNCHRMIHRKRDKCLTVEELKSYVNHNLSFCI